MKTMFEFENLTEFADYFCDEKTCAEHLAAIRFRNGEYCPHCRHDRIFKFNDGKRYRCAKCKTDFTIRNGTVFGDSKLPLRKWFMAIYLLTTSGKGISSYQLAKQIRVTQKTAWFMNHRIRSAAKQNNGQLFGQVEADETWVGGKDKNKHISKRPRLGRGPVGKLPVAGIVERGGKVVAKVIPEVSRAVLHGFINANVKEGSTVNTDEHRGYWGMKNYTHQVIRHSLREYVVGSTHTNTIESFWALFKRGYHGVYHFMSKKHLQRYVDEFAFRFNRRGGAMQTIFHDTVEKMIEGIQLPYQTLIQKPL
jgi:transposase-like protein